MTWLPGRFSMDRYQLAKIVDWAGTLRSQKRMQKLIYLLQAAGCPLDADYDFHNHGPYSFDVARLTDELTREGLLEDSKEGEPFGERYSYSLPQETKQQMTADEESTRGCDQARHLDKFAGLARILCETQPEEPRSHQSLSSSGSVGTIGQKPSPRLASSGI